MLDLKTEYVTIGGLAFRSQGINIYDHSDLHGAAAKTGDDFAADQMDGVDPQQRWEDGFDARLFARIKGRWTVTNTRVARSLWIATYYEHLAAVRAVTTVNTVQTLELHTPAGTYTSTECIVTGGIRPNRIQPDVCTFQIRVRLAGGTLL